MGVRVKPDKYKAGRWWVRINHQGRRKSLAFGSKKAAELAAVRIDAALKLGNVGVLDPPPPPSSPMPTLRDYAEQWLETVGSVRLRPSTAGQYCTRLNGPHYPSPGHPSL